MVTLNPTKSRRPARAAADGSVSAVAVMDPMDFVAHESFSSRKTEERLFGPGAEAIDVPAWSYLPEAADDLDGMIGHRRALRAPQEVQLFLRYNYAKYRLRELLAARRRGGRPAQSGELLLWYRRMMECKESLARANLALVVAMAKRTRIANVDFAELISEGNMALLRALEKFDVSRGFKFSTYACRAILKSFNRLASKTGRYRKYFPTEFDPELEQPDPHVSRQDIEHREWVEELHHVLRANRAALSSLERKVVAQRFALGSKDGKGLTLSEVGRRVGLTNERVRQIQNAALRKLRAVLIDEGEAA